MAPTSSTIQRALTHHRAGELDRAVALYRHALRVDPGDAQTHHLLAQALRSLGQLESAAESLRIAVRADPGALELREARASVLAEMGEADASVAVWQDLVAISNGAPEACVGLARQLAAIRRAEEGLRVAEEAAARHPRHQLIIREIAKLSERLGLPDDARTASERLMAIDPGSADATYMLAHLDARAGRLEDAERRLREFIAARPGAAAGFLHTELALVQDKLGRFDIAFGNATEAQRLNFAALPEAARDRRDHESIIAGALALTQSDVAQWPVPPEAEPHPPIFVVGFPRSGTTLVEQILSAHPRLCVSDELPNLQSVRLRMHDTFQPGSRFPQMLGSFTPEQVRTGRRWYLERAYRTVPGAQVSSGGPRRRIVDKQPLNTVEMCFARLIFPESPVIYVQRDPRDTVLSVHLQGFTRAVPHLFSLEGTARLYDLFARVWQHYQSVLGLRSLTIRYEDLVDDPERWTRTLLEFIGEPWDPAVMNFHAPAHRRYITTPSYNDVAQPVYKRAVGRWSNYARHLAPVLPVLEPWVHEGGYA